MTPDRDRLLNLLRAKPLQYMVHLKHLHLYPNEVQASVIESNSEFGVLLSFDPAVTSWDQSLYPTASRIYLPTATSREIAQRLYGQVEMQSGNEIFVCKFCESETCDVFAQNFRLQQVKTFISYTMERLALNVDLNNVIISNQLDEHVAALYEANGYDRDELVTLFAEGALSFTIYQDNMPICTCFIYQNFGDIWEIGGVRTIESARHRGYARRVVSVALKTILDRGWIPRYQIESTNTASIGLAESVGLTPCLHFEHYIRLA